MGKKSKRKSSEKRSGSVVVQNSCDTTLGTTSNTVLVPFNEKVTFKNALKSYRGNDFATILQMEQNIIRLVNATEDARLKMMHFYNLGRAHLALWSTHKNCLADAARSEKFLEKAIEISVLYGLEEVQFGAHNCAFCLIRLYVEMNNMEKAMVIYRGLIENGHFLPTNCLAGLIVKMFKAAEYSHVTTMLVDHMDTLESVTDISGKKQLCIMYTYLAGAYEGNNEFIKSKTWLLKQLNTSREIKDEEIELRALKSLGDHSLRTGKYDEAMGYFKTCENILSQLTRSDSGLLQANIFGAMGDAIKYRSVSESGRITSRAKEMSASMYSKAISQLSSGEAAATEPYIIAKACYLRKIGVMFANMKKWDQALENISSSIEVTNGKTNQTKAMANAYAMKAAGKVHIDMYFDSLSSSTEAGTNPSGIKDHLHNALRHSNEALDIYSKEDPTEMHKKVTSLLLHLAQEHYFLENHDEAFCKLSWFLDNTVLHGTRRCHSCGQISGIDAVTKECTCCKSAFYCSTVCQQRDWQNVDDKRLRHKLLCPLLTYWRARWGHEISKTVNNSERWFEIASSSEGESIAAIFLEYFESVTKQMQK